MKNSIIRCDFCEKQLNEDTKYPHNYCLNLREVDYGVNSFGMQYAVHMIPSLDRDYDFCGITCLSNWITKRMNEQ